MTFEIVITTDRTMMTNHHGKEFLGFVATGPPIGMPERLWLYLTAPPMKVDRLGRPREAPYGMRKIEAVLIDKGYNAAVVDPGHISKHLDTLKVLMISHHDYFAYGPPSSEWWSLTGIEPVNRRSFIKFMRTPAVRKAKEKGTRIIAGGPAAWQWFYELDLWEEFGVDTVVEGEGEKVVVEIVEKALNGEPLPKYVSSGSFNVPSVDEIPVIKAPSVNGLVEIMRGCPRGCKFCSVTLRPLRFIPIEKIVKEVEVNLRGGTRGIILHSDDVFLYGADGVIPRSEPLLKLHEEVMGLLGPEKSFAWSHVSLSALKYAEENYGLVSKLMGDIILTDKRRMIGVEVGVETGSVRLARQIMVGKSRPYPVDMWPDIVEDAFRIMHENSIVPAATLILGFPGETADDVAKTIELLERLRKYRSIIVPMFFVPMGALKGSNWFLRQYLTQEHVTAMMMLYEHDIYWAEDILRRFYLRGLSYLPLRFLLKYFIGYVKRKVREQREILEAMIKK